MMSRIIGKEDPVFWKDSHSPYYILPNGKISGYGDQGGFQLLDLIITELKSHMTCYNSMPLIG